MAAAFAAVVFLAATAEAESGALYVRADFNDLEPGPLAAQGGGTGFAAGSTWAACDGVVLQEGDLSAPPPKGGRYVRSQYGEPRRVQGVSTATGRAERILARPMPGVVWFSFLVRPREGVGCAGIQLLGATDGDSSVSVLASGCDLTVRVSSPSREVRRIGAFPADESSLVLGCIAIDAGSSGEDRLSVWIQPDVTGRGEPLLEVADIDCIGKAVTRIALLASGRDNNGGVTAPELDGIVLSNYADPAGFYHVAPRLRFTGPFHIPVQTAAEATPLPPPGYEMVWSDEFNGTALDMDQWEHRLRAKADSVQLADNVEVSDGHLVIHARKQRVENHNYSGGGVIGRQTFVYGYYEARLKVPSAEGWHTSFWTFPVLDKELKGSEIDFLEQDSGDPHLYSFGVIDQQIRGWTGKNVGRWVVEDAPNMARKFVVVSAEFTPDSIRFYLNGHLKMELESAAFPQGPGSVRLSCIGTRKKGDRFQDDARLPDRAMFDYVRVYQHPRYAEAEAAARRRATKRMVRPPPHAPSQPDTGDSPLD